MTEHLIDRTGRIDVLIARLAMAGLEELARRVQRPELAREARPIVESIVSELVPAKSLFPNRRPLC